MTTAALMITRAPKTQLTSRSIVAATRYLGASCNVQRIHDLSNLINVVEQDCRDEKSYTHSNRLRTDRKKQTSASLTSLPLHWRYWTKPPPPVSAVYCRIPADQRSASAKGHACSPMIGLVASGCVVLGSTVASVARGNV